MRALLWLPVVALMLGCAPSRPPAVLVEKVSGTFQPGPEDKAEILARVAAYWQALEDERWDIAYTMTTLDFQEAHPFHAWRRQQAAVYGGPRKLVLLHWLQDSPRMPGPERFAVTGWTVGPPDDPVAHGHLVWRFERRVYLIQSEEINVRRARPAA